MPIAQDFHFEYHQRTRLESV